MFLNIAHASYEMYNTHDVYMYRKVRYLINALASTVLEEVLVLFDKHIYLLGLYRERARAYIR